MNNISIIIENAWKKATSQVAFTNDLHYDVAFTWYSKGYLDAVSKENNNISESVKKYSIYLSDNSQEIRDLLEKEGFYICPCCTFANSKWLHFLLRDDNKKEVHGIGYSCENQCKGVSIEKCIQCSIKESLHTQTTCICKTVEDFITLTHALYDTGTSNS